MIVDWVLVVQSSIANHKSKWPPSTNGRSFPLGGFDPKRATGKLGALSHV
jgi:hypothetical protein